MRACGRKPRNEYRPKRPCSADSSRNDGPAPSSGSARSFRKAETGVSQSSMKRSTTGTTVALPATRSAAPIQDLQRRGERDLARAEQDLQVVEHVGGLLGDPLVGLAGGRAGDLVGLLAHLVADSRRVGEELRRVAAVRALGGAGGDRALERSQGLVHRGVRRLPRVEVAMEAGTLARVAGGTGRLLH